MTDYADTADALSVLAHETRLEIVRALADAAEPVTFTELRERVGIRDTGKFNYHLTELCGYFVRETGGGYELGYPGERVAEDDGRIEATAQTDETDETGVCGVCGEEDCEKLFHVHVSPPWR